MKQAQIIEHFKIMDESLQSTLDSGDVKDMERFSLSSELMCNEVPKLREHLYLPKNLEYLLDHINYAPIYDFRRSYQVAGYKHRTSGYVLKS